MASAGFRTTIRSSEPFALTRKKRAAVILQPADGTEVEAGKRLWLVGGAQSPNHGIASEHETQWFLDDHAMLGKGFRLLIDQLRPGDHRIMVRAPDGEGGMCSVTRRIRVVTNLTNPPVFQPRNEP